MRSKGAPQARIKARRPPASVFSVEGIRAGPRADGSDLILSAQGGSLEDARKAVDGGAPVDSRDPRGRSALMIAAARGDAAMCALLIERKADPRLKDKDGLGARDHALRGRSEEGNEALWLIEGRLKGCLIESIKSSDARGLRESLDAGADCSAIDSEGRSALELSMGNAALRALLLTSMLAKSIERDDAKGILEALDQGADILGKDGRGQNAYALARSLGRTALSDALLRRMNSMLIDAIRDGERPLALRLLDGGASVNSRDEGSGATPLMVSCMSEDSAMAGMLLDRGAQVDARDLKGRSALLYAAISGSMAGVRLLLERGADPALHSAQGKSAHALALEHGNEGIALLLSKELGKRLSLALKGYADGSDPISLARAGDLLAAGAEPSTHGCRTLLSQALLKAASELGQGPLNRP